MGRHSPKHPIDHILDAARRRNETLRSHTLEVAIDFERLVCLVLGTESIPDEWRPKLMAPAAAAATPPQPVMPQPVMPQPAPPPEVPTFTEPVQPASAPATPPAPHGAEPTGQRRFSAEAIIFKQGDAANEFYVITQGIVCLYNPGGSQPVARLGPGETFGEQSILIGGVRSLSAVAETEVLAVCLRADGLRAALESEPGLIRPVFESMLLQLYLQNDLTSRGHPVLP
jgi:hypothetical protein